jgi:hypothetical protein
VDAKKFAVALALSLASLLSPLKISFLRRRPLLAGWWAEKVESAGRSALLFRRHRRKIASEKMAVRMLCVASHRFLLFLLGTLGRDTEIAAGAVTAALRRVIATC